MILRMTTTSGPQRRYDDRLRDLVQRTGDLTVATDLGVPRSTARGWLAAAPAAVVSVDVATLTEPELREEVLKLRNASIKSRRCSAWRLPSYTRPSSGSQGRGCQMGKPNGGSCAPWIARVSVSRCEESCGSCICPPVGIRRGAAGRPPVRSTFGHPALGQRLTD